MNIVEYKVRPVTRYIITKFSNDEEARTGGIETLGEFDNESIAERIKTALEAAETKAIADQMMADDLAAQRAQASLK